MGDSTNAMTISELESRKVGLEAAFQDNFANRSEVGAAVCIWHNGKEALSLQGGLKDRDQTSPFTIDTPVCLFSVTKALASTCLLRVLAEEGISLSRKVIDVWPNFGQNGKSEVTLAQLLSHQAGLAGLENGAQISIFDYDAITHAFEVATPLWKLGTGHGYHAKTFGNLLDAILRHIRPDTTIGKYWHETFAVPLELSMWIGIPPEMNDDVARIYPARLPSTSASGEPSQPRAPKSAFFKALETPGSVTQQTFATLGGLVGQNGLNSLRARTTELPSLGGIGAARSVSKFFAVLANRGEWEGKMYLPRGVYEQMTTRLTSGFDMTLQITTAFSAGLMMDALDASGKKLHYFFGTSPSAFGHPGAGGSMGFADPENGLAFAYLVNQMEYAVFPSQKTACLVNALYPRDQGAAK